MGLLIHDGHTLEGKIPARGHWPEVNFRYRPALPEDVYEYAYQSNAAPGKGRAKAVIGLLNRQLVSWDVTDEKGESVPITAENLKRVPHGYLEKFLDYVTGYSAE